MNNLCTYIATTKGDVNSVTLESSRSFDKSYIDHDIVVSCIESIFHFTNGVVMKFCSESDLTEANEQVCPECWISYEIISETGDTQISPKRKTFINQCQETFWLKINTNSANM
jgi:hypothetical protein